MVKKHITSSTSKRIPLYYKVFLSLEKQGVLMIKSQELATLMNIEPSIVRRDLSQIGRLGMKGQGYQVKMVLEYLEQIFSLKNLIGSVLIGFGDLGQALARYLNKQGTLTQVIQVYDSNPLKIGQDFLGMKILDQCLIASTLNKDVKIAILALPADKVQESLNQLVDLGIKAFVNFSGAKVYHPNQEVIIKDVDIMQVMHSLIYEMNLD